MNILQQNIEFNKYLFDFINQLNSEYINGAIILVEGKKDTNALVSLGFMPIPNCRRMEAKCQ